MKREVGFCNALLGKVVWGESKEKRLNSRSGLVQSRKKMPTVEVGPKRDVSSARAGFRN